MITTFIHNVEVCTSIGTCDWLSDMGDLCTIFSPPNDPSSVPPLRLQVVHLPSLAAQLIRSRIRRKAALRFIGLTPNQLCALGCCESLARD